MIPIIIAFVILSQINLVLCKTYSNYTVFRAIPIIEEHVEYLQNLSHTYKVDFWRPPGNVNRPVDVMLGPDDKENFLSDVQELNLYVTTVIDDVQRAFDSQTVKSYVRRNMESFDWNNFYRYKDICNWLIDLKREYPQEIKLRTIGRSEENRELISVSVVLNKATVRSTVIVEGGIHAREWISISFVTYMLYQILTAPESTSNKLKNIASTYEWIFVPMLNPDGYEYTHTDDRLWRKNRRSGYGVDINRNFDCKFGTLGISFTKDDNIYCGPNVFSEKEAIAMADLVKRKKDTLEFYLGFHSYGQYIILPYAYSARHFENYDEMKQMCDSAASRIFRRFGTTYETGTAYETVGYRTSGASSCWVKERYHVPYVAVFELRDVGQHGFALPPSQILPTCLETMDGMISLLTPRTEKYIPLKKDATDGQEKTFLNHIVIVFNVLIFIIVRID